MASEVLLGFTIQLMYTNDIFSCMYNLFETKISRQVGEQLFVYVLLAAVTLPPEQYFLIKRAVSK